MVSRKKTKIPSISTTKTASGVGAPGAGIPGAPGHPGAPSSGGFPFASQAQQHYSSPLPKNVFMRIFHYLHGHILYLNNSKFFAGVIMIMLNIGSKFISVQFSKSTEEYLKYTLSKQVLVFAMVWMATRDIYTALGLTAVFIILSEYIFNEESSYCVVPHHKRVLKLKTAIDTNNDGVISETEINSAIATLEKAKKEKEKKTQKELFYKYYDYQNVEDTGSLSNLAAQNDLPPTNP
jgi:hypothetical protein